jgi:hypothetical protein
VLHRVLAAGLALALTAAGAAHAQEGLFGRDTLHGLAEVRWAGADAETSWLDGGFGKTGGETAGLSQAVVEWRPRLSFAVSAVVSAQWQEGASPNLDLNEAYLKLKAPPNRLGRLSARAGWFYPPVSL